jgi:RecA/RadA recombinase
MKLKDILKVAGNKYGAIASEGLDGSDVKSFISTGSYSFNALLSGSIYGGIPDNKIIALAGEQATGKTYFALNVVREFLNSSPQAMVLYFDTEQAITLDMLQSRGVDTERVAVLPVATIEDFRQQCISVVDKYLEEDKDTRPPMMIVLDSLGMLSTEKEISDTAEGKNVRDMTRAQVAKAVFRVLTIKLGHARIPLLMTNHTYDVIGAYVPTKEMGGGSGLKYAASTIIYLSKKKDKVDGEVVGNIIHCKTYKSRLTKQDKMVDVQLNFESGLNKFYGLTEIALKHGIFKKVSTKIELPNGKTVFETQINRDPEKYFTEDVLKAIDAAARKEFCYGSEEKEEADANNDEFRRTDGES